MGNFIDYLQDGTQINIIEIPESDYKKYCVRCTKEMWIDFTTQTIAPCSFSSGVHIGDYDGFFQYVNDINSNVKRPECNYCHNINPNFRLEGNKIWTTPGHGNCHVEFILDSQYNHNILHKFVTQIAKDYQKFACICIAGNEPGQTILEQNHIALIAEPFFGTNKRLNRQLRYDFKTNLQFSVTRTKKIIKYIKQMKETYPKLDINIQPSEKSLDNVNFNRKIDLFVDAGFEIFVTSRAVKDHLESRYHDHKTIKLTFGV